MLNKQKVESDGLLIDNTRSRNLKKPKH